MEQPKVWKLLHNRLQEAIRNGLNRQIVMEFCDVRKSAFNGWLAQTYGPRGERLIRLWWILKTAGVPSPELDRLDPVVQRSAELLAFQIITLEEAMDILNVKGEQNAYKVLRGEVRSLRPHYSVQELEVLYSEQLDVARRKLQARIGSLKPSAAVPQPQGPHHSEPMVQSGKSQSPAKQVAKLPETVLGMPASVLLASLIGAALPLARHVVSDTVTPAERSDLRDLVGQPNLFEFLNLMTALQSERARNNRK